MEVVTIEQTPTQRRRPGGRPAKSPDQVLSAPLQVRLTVGERAALDALAERQGRSVTDLVRSAVRESLGPLDRVHGKPGRES